MTDILLKIYLDDSPFKAKKFKVDLDLSEVRRQLEDSIPNDSNFTTEDGIKIEVEDEESIKINEIAKDGKINIISSKKDNNSNNESFKLLSRSSNSEDLNQSDSQEEDSIKIEKGKNKKEKAKKSIKRKNGRIAKNGELSEEEDEKYIEEKTREKPKKNFSDDEKDRSLMELSSKKRKRDDYIPSDILPEEKPKQPIEGSILLEKIGDLSIYLYPSAKFTDYETSIAITLMVVGETGSGKTTLINAFINSLLGIKYEDKLR